MVNGVRMIKLLITLAGLLMVSAGALAHDKPSLTGISGFDIYRDGNVLHLITADFGDGRAPRALLYRRSTDDGRTWTVPVRVNGDGAPVYDLVRGNDPQIAAHGSTVVAVWTVKGSGFGGSGPLLSAVSKDNGRTWQPAGNPADDGSNAGHAFIEILGGANGFDLVWLDGRDGSQGLRHARLGLDASKWSANTTVQKATCECCWNTLTRRGEATYVMYRGRGPRDMGLAEQPRPGAPWQHVSTVGAFNWDFQGCPHTGGGSAWSGGEKNLLHAVVWTGAQDEQGLHYLKSSDRGRTWSPPYRIGSREARRADLAAHEDGRILLVWDQLEGRRRAIYAMQSMDSGTRWHPAKRLSGTEADASYPRAVPTRNGFLVAWTESAGSASAVMKEVTLTH